MYSHMLIMPLYSGGDKLREVSALLKVTQLGLAKPEFTKDKSGCKSPGRFPGAGTLWLNPEEWMIL